MQKLKRLFLPVAIGLALLSTSAPAYAKDYRDAGIFSRDKGTYVWSSEKYNGTTYDNQNEGGFTVYVPYQSFMTGQDKFRSMFTRLFDIYNSGYGDTYSSAAMRWTAPQYSNINGIDTQYFVKRLSTTDNDNESAMATSNLGDFSPNYNVEFRYAGVMIDTKNTRRGTVVTNPTFASDWIQEPKNGQSGNRTYTLYNKSKEATESYSLNLLDTTEIKQYAWLIDNYPGGSGVPTNYPKQSPYYGTAEEVFTTWAERSEIGERYKEAYTPIAANMGKQWWELLRDYMRIDGDIKPQSVTLTLVYHNGSPSGHIRYKTYYIPFPIQNNVVAYSIQILDDKNEIVEKSERPLEKVTDAFSGADGIDKNIKTGERIKLKVGKTYKAELGMVYATTKNVYSQTDKTAEEGRPQIQVWSDVSGNNGGLEAAPFKEIGTANASNIEGLNALEEDWMDHDTHTDHLTAMGKYSVMGDTSNMDYYVGMAGYCAMAFTVDDQFPEKGHLRFIVPQAYTDNGDNEYKGDDIIELDYELDESDDGDNPTPEKDLTGDMNLGRREYRRLHYKKTVEEDDPDNPIYSTDPTTGEQTLTGYAKKQVDYEYATDYGWYETYASSPDGEKVGDWNGVPEASGSIYPIDDKSWWEYDQQWPDQGEDSYYKIWLTKAGTSWSKSTETYYRSETADYPFTLGFSTSRSRGQESDQINPKIKVQIYGISPDTDEDGELISTQIITGNQIGTYQYSTNNYMYLTDKYIAERYGNGDYPRIRVHAEIDKTTHGESGIYGDSKVSPYQNGWQDEHDSYDRTFECISDDMEITDIMVKDSEGIVVYHAKQDNGNCF